MNLYTFLVNAYNTFISVFPGPLQWLVTLLILVGVVTAVLVLVRHHILFLIAVILLLPFIIPVVASLLGDIYNFVLFLLQVLHLAPQPPA